MRISPPFGNGASKYFFKGVVGFICLYPLKLGVTRKGSQLKFWTYPLNPNFGATDEIEKRLKMYFVII